MSNSDIQATNEVSEVFTGLEIDGNMTAETDTVFENSDYYSEDDYWDEYEDRVKYSALPRLGHWLKNGKLLDKRGSNQEKFTSLRPKALIKYSKRDIAAKALDNDVDADAKLIIKRIAEDFHEVNDVICCGERSVLIHCSGRLDTDTGKPLEFLIKVYRLQFGLDRIQQWALKEYENMYYMFKHVNVPNTYCPTKNVAILNFIGDDGIPAPSLNKVAFEITEKIYADVVLSMYKLYNEGQMVHGKLSARTILWWRDKLWFVSLSHAVKREHPDALRMLMKDCCHITLFFKKKSVLKVKSIMNLFKYITGMDKIDHSVLQVLKHTRKPVKHRLKKTKQHQEET